VTSRMALGPDVELASEHEGSVAAETRGKKRKPVGARERKLAVKGVSWIATVCCILLVPAILLAATGYNPLTVYTQIASGSVGSVQRLLMSLDKSIGLIFVGLAATVAFRCGVWNLGLQGQLLMGGLGAAIGGLYLGNLATPLHIFVMVLLALAGGAVWGLIPAVLRQRFKVNELVSSLLLNYVAFYLIVYMVRWPMHGTMTIGPHTDTISPTAMIPAFSASYSLKISFVFALLLGLLIAWLFNSTVYGYWISAIGHNPLASRLGGISVTKVIIVVFLVSGALAGLAGMNEVAGTTHSLGENIAVNYGFFGVAAALIGGMRPMVVVLVSIFIGCLLTGGLWVQSTLGVSSDVVLIIIACFLIGLLLEPVIERRLQGAMVEEVR
jgi:general nucleoside transport system permease protein